jgi:hypothetical protein
VTDAEAALAPAPPPRSLRARWESLLWLLGCAFATASFALVPFQADCGFKFLVGAPCPGCGMTRACLGLLSGDVAGSLRFHPLALPGILAFGAAAALAVHEGATGRPTFRARADRWGTRAAVGMLIALAGVWFLRVVVVPAWSPDPIRPGSLAARLLE